MRRAYAASAWRRARSADQRRADDRQAERLIGGEDMEAWTNRRSGAVVPLVDRPRVFRLGLGYLEDRTSNSLRGGVTYAVAKHHRWTPAMPGTEHAAVSARGDAGEEPGRHRPRSRTPSTPTPVEMVLSGPSPAESTAGDPVDQWERDHPEECLRLRDEVARRLASEVGHRQVSERMLRIKGQGQDRHLIIQRVGGQRVRSSTGLRCWKRCHAMS